MSNFRYENGTQPFNSLSLKLLYISSSKYEKDWHSTMHAHEFTELFYVVSGQGRFQVEELSFPVTIDDMVIINPQVEHTEIGVHKKPMEYIVLGIEGGGFLLNEGEDPRYCAFNCGVHGSSFLFYLREMLHELEGRGPHFNSAAQNLLEIFSIKLLRYKAVTVATQPLQKSSHGSAHVKRYIDQHYTENITLEMLAGVANLNKYYLVHTFSQDYGISPINYLIRRRIDESLYYLKSTNYNVSQISQILGFSSSSYFSQSFKRLEKTSPREYRQRALEQENSVSGL